METDRIGPYRILRLLGEGGMGLVYEAEQRVTMRRRVAVKVMKPGLDTKDVIARFEAERQALAVMEHPGIARVFDAGETEEGRPYFVMELVHGEPLKEFADGHKLPIQDRLELFIRICRAVQHAHMKGVVHRDLKPSNILVEERDGIPHPKIIDFGIAKATGRRLTEETLVTQFGQALGTPAYMSPEQAESTGIDIDTRTDIYSLGVTLYELLVGRLPTDPAEVGPQAFLASLMLRESDPPTPSTRYSTLDGEYRNAIARFRRTDPGSLQRQIRGDLDWIVMKAMEKDRSRRYETANGLAMDLERYLREEPVLARPPSARYRASKFIRRHPAGVAMAVAFSGLILAFSGITSVQAARIAGERDRAEEEAAKAREVTDVMVDMFRVSNPSEALGNSITVREVMDRGVAQVRSGLGGQPTIQAHLLQTIGRVYFNLGLYDESERLLADALDIVTVQFGDQSMERASGLTDLAQVSWRKSDLARADSLIRQSIAVADLELDASTEERGRIQHVSGIILSERGFWEEAETAFLAALELRERVEPPNLGDVAKTLNSLGVVYLNRGQYEDAVKYLTRALEVKRKFLDPYHPSLAVTMYNLGIQQMDLGRYEEAEANLVEALEIWEHVHGENHLDVADALDTIGGLKAELGEYDEAEELHIRALEIRESLLDPGHSDLAFSHNSLANLFRRRGNHERALGHFDQADDLFAANFGPDHWIVAQNLASKAVSLRELERHEEAETSFLRAFEILEVEWEPDHPDLVAARAEYAELLRRVDSASHAQP
jgi:non-specific serine/threonine protein kinase/serine/threonine-protein kinase